jgi:hypothetical protein
MAKRIQRKRTKGWRMPEGAIYVGRPTVWGNRYTVGTPGTGLGVVATAREAVDGFRRMWSEPHQIGYIRERLAGKDLACWCPLDQPCHADVLLEIANPVAQETERGR